MRKASYPGLIEKYENSIGHTCDLKEGQVFISQGWKKPSDMCDNAWESMSVFVMTLAHGDTVAKGCMMGEKSVLSYDFLQRWLSACQFFD